MVKDNKYEEARIQRIEENKKRFKDLGITGISKSLADLTNAEKKSQFVMKQHLLKQKSESAYVLEPRRSSRSRNPVPSYHDDLQVDIGLPSFRKRSKSSSWASYLARPIDEVKTASYKERVYAIKAAEELQCNLQSQNPSFVKSMLRSHVYSCFWLGLPSKFCEDHLTKSDSNMILENEDGTEYEAVFLGKRTGLSGGWRAFALDHKLDDGDALVFELTEQTRFKIYIVRASSLPSRKHNIGKEASIVGKEKGRQLRSKQTQKSKEDISPGTNILSSMQKGEDIDSKLEEDNDAEKQSSYPRTRGKKKVKQ